ncbi:MAG: FtsX-like permease family protein [bacterium]
MLCELRLALRFLFVSPKGFYRASRLFTIITIAVSVAALLVSLSAFNGYMRVISQRYLDSTSHIVISEHYGKELNVKKTVKDILGNRLEDIKYFGYLELLVSSKKGVRGVAFEVSEPGSFDYVLPIKKYMQTGDPNCIFKKSNSVIVGSAVAEILGLSVGSDLNILYSGRELGKGIRVLQVCGVVDFGLYDLDSRFAYISTSTGNNLFPEANFNTSLRIRLNDGTDLNKAVDDIYMSSSPGLHIRSWKDINYGMFESVKLDRLVIFFILSVLIAVAVFNIVATLILLIREMRTEISILQVLGLSMKRLICIFFFKSLFLGLTGYIFGLFLWLSSILVVKKWGVIVLPKDVYLVSKIPMYVSVVDMFYVLAIVILFVSLASILPLMHLFKKFKREGVAYGIRGQSAQ